MKPYKVCVYHPDKEPKYVWNDEAEDYYASGWVDTPDKFPKDEQEANTVLDLMDMSKSELEEYAREFGIELDRRKTKANMLNDFEEALNDRSGDN